MEPSSSSRKRVNAVDERDEWETAYPLTLVGGNRPYHVMSVLLAEHSHSRGILGFLTLRDANSLRSVCKELRDEVSVFRWKDMRTRINGRLDLWRICFPRAVSANLRGRFDLMAGDFVHLSGIKHLDVTGEEVCSHGEMTFPDSSFKHIRGIQSLTISGCRQLSDAAFVHLKDIHTLNMADCHQDTITDAAFAHLKGIHTLNISNCDQASITGSSLHLLLGITTLGCSLCKPSIREAARAVLDASKRLG